MNNLLTINEIKDDELWDLFILKSENKNFYSLSKIINNYTKTKKKFFIKKADEILGSFHIFISDNVVNNGNTIYSPLNFKKFDKIKKPGLTYKKFLIIEKYANYLIENFSKGEVTLDFNTDDMRAFHWINHDKKKTIFKIDEIRYTSLIDTKNFHLDFDNFEKSLFYSNLSRSIKQQIKSANTNNYTFKNSFDSNFAKKIIKQNFDFPDIDKFFDIYNHYYKLGLLQMYITSKSETDLAFSIFSVIGDKAIYLSGGRLEKSNQDYSTTYNLINSFFSLKKLGIKEIDLEGVNSPNRGFWKSGFGGSLTPYYKIKFNH
ncbi:hypothetical protein N9586_01340 [Candidatus Pelagibacter sp.]|nr:hypothetical protein [Candidatus Pelagibacter sp.]